jgi:hypothetical protein
MVFLNLTENAHEAYRRGLIHESRYSYRVMRLTWKGWARVEELQLDGHAAPTEEQLDAYAKHARIVVEGGDHGDYIPIVVPNPRGVTQKPRVAMVKRRGVMQHVRAWFKREEAQRG